MAYPNPRIIWNDILFLGKNIVGQELKIHLFFTKRILE